MDHPETAAHVSETLAILEDAMDRVRRLSQQLARSPEVVGRPTVERGVALVDQEVEDRVQAGDHRPGGPAQARMTRPQSSPRAPTVVTSQPGPGW